jgi:regulatory protein
MSSAYITALKLLAGRELSEHHVRLRLARRKFDPDAIDEAVARLKEEGAIDDARAAAAIARNQTTIRKRGQMRVRHAIEHMGISRALAKRTTDEMFAGLDVDALIEAALAKRLRARTRIADDKEFARLYRYLVGQGFEHDRVIKLLESRRKSAD